ncbi:MAG: hypothetical protein QW334_04545 [Thermofilum sp.]
MLRGLIRKILVLMTILVAGALVKSLIDSAWRSLGLDPKGLSSLITIVIIGFSATLLIPLKGSFKNRVRGLFKGLITFLSIWVAAAFSAAILHISSYIQIGLILALTYVFLRLRTFTRLGGIRLRILCEKQPVKLEGYTLLLSVAPVPKAVFLDGFSVRGAMRVFKGEARARLRLPEDVFMESFKHRQTLELRGSLSSLAEKAGEILPDGAAILCEAKPSGNSFKIRVEIASDSPQSLKRLSEKLRRLSPEPVGSVEHALEKWCSLKPCVKPVSEVLGYSFDTDLLTGRLLIVGDSERAEKLALEICLTQLRRNTVVLVTGGEGKAGDGLGDGVDKMLAEKGFRLSEKPVKTYRGRDGVEVVFAGNASSKALLKKTSSKPVVAAWLRNSNQCLMINAPVEVLTLGEPNAYLDFEAGGMILVECERSLAESFLPFRYGFAIEGKTALVSRKGVRILG